MVVWLADEAVVVMVVVVVFAVVVVVFAIVCARLYVVLHYFGAEIRPRTISLTCSLKELKKREDIQTDRQTDRGEVYILTGVGCAT